MTISATSVTLHHKKNDSFSRLKKQTLVILVNQSELNLNLTLKFCITHHFQGKKGNIYVRIKFYCNYYMVRVKHTRQRLNTYQNKDITGHKKAGYDVVVSRLISARHDIS